MQRQSRELQNRALGSPLMILQHTCHRSYDQYLPIYLTLKIRNQYQDIPDYLLVLLKILLLLFKQTCTKHMIDFENSMFCSKVWAQRQSSGPSFGLRGMKAPNMRGW